MVDQGNLERLSRKTGDQVINLTTTSTEDAITAVAGVAFQFLHARVISGKVTDLVPELPEPVTRGFSLAGRCEGKCEIEVAFGFAGEATVTKRIKLDPSDALDAEQGNFVHRVWAQRKISELSVDPQRNEAAITALGIEHRVVTAGTSLLVLDRIEDYARHQIEPPEAELREQYLALLTAQKKNKSDKDEAAHLDQVAKEWQEFKDWHAKRHPWLETVLKPTAEREAALYAALSGPATQKNQKGTLSTEDAAAARALADKAADLAKRWAKEGREEETRSAWITEASNVMLAVDVLRQRRLEIIPDSDKGLNEGSAAPAAPAAEGAANFLPGGASESASRSRTLTMAPASAPAPSPMVAADAVSGTSAGKPASNGRTAMSGTIEVKAWDPDTPYLKKLRKADDAYAAYLKERRSNASSSAFFLDCADYFREEKKDERLALRILSNLAEMELENAPLLRILAYRLQQLNRHDLAVPLFEEVLKMRGEEPQSRRDLALCLSRKQEPDFTRAAALLWEVVKKKWDGRFPGIEVIALHELNDLLERAPESARPKVEDIGIEKRFLEGVPVDLRVVLTWDADNTDMDLWVIDPTGEICIYNHNQTKTGGMMSPDCTRGYGPEAFTIRHALPGTYTVKVNYFGSSQQKLAGATTVQIEFQTAFSQKAGERQAVTRRLEGKRDVIEIGKFVFKPQSVEAE